MDRYVTLTELRQNLRTVKQCAREGVVHVTHKGRPAYVLCSFELWERNIQAARRRGIYRAELWESLSDSQRDIEQGRVVRVGEAPALGMLDVEDCFMTESAQTALELEYDAEQRSLLAEVLRELVRSPRVGMPIDEEYDGLDKPIRKFYSPPCDILYDVGDKGRITIHGFVRSLEEESILQGN